MVCGVRSVALSLRMVAIVVIIVPHSSIPY